MSKITKTVTYEIEPNGDCEECESRVLDYLDRVHCLAFGALLHRLSNQPINQCQDCKDYLTERKSKVHCDGCRHFCYGYNFSTCNKGKKIKFDQDFDPENWYSSNCQDREE